MRGVIRRGDICTGHGCFTPRRNISASNNIFVNSRGIHRRTDRWITHCCGTSCHDGVTIAGSSIVFANGLEIARKYDPINCGSLCNTHSPDTFCGCS